jgi:hypothetical protein
MRPLRILVIGRRKSVSGGTESRHSQRVFGIPLQRLEGSCLIDLSELPGNVSVRDAAVGIQQALWLLITLSGSSVGTPDEKQGEETMKMCLRGEIMTEQPPDPNDRNGRPGSVRTGMRWTLGMSAPSMRCP